MAEPTTQSMIADRLRGAMRTRLKQLYVEQGYDPATAEALAIAEMSRRDRQRLASEPTGFEGETGRSFEREILRSDPRRLAAGQPAPQMDVFRETPPTRDEAQRGLPQASTPRASRETINAPSQFPLVPSQMYDFLVGTSPRTPVETIGFTDADEAERRANRSDEVRGVVDAASRAGRAFIPGEVEAAYSMARRMAASPSEESGFSYRPNQPQMLAPTQARSGFSYDPNRVETPEEERSRRISEEITGPSSASVNRNLATNRIIDRAMTTITGAPAAVAQPAVQTINGQPVVPPAPEPPAEEVTEPGFSGQSGRILEEALAKARASTDPARTTSVTPARTVSRPTPSAPTQAPVAATQASGFFGNLFRDPYAGKSSRELYEEYQRRGDDDSAMYARAAARQLEEQRAAGMAHGGAAAGGKGGHHKDAVVMKALEIIHHMLRGR